jgi:copper chaperone CopZ
MSFIKNLALACSTVVALTFAISQANAAPAVTEAHAHTHDHAHAHAPKADGTEWVAPKTKLKSTGEETLIYVDEMHCGHCAKKITSKLYAVKGVVKVRTDVKAGLAIITPQAKKKVDPLALWTAASKSGFPATRLISPTGTYVLDAKTKKAQLVPEKPVSETLVPAKSVAPKS